MTAYALRLENATDTAARVRVGDLLGLSPAGPLTTASGVRPAATAADVAVDDGTMTVTVQPFMGWVQGGVSVTQGGYPFVCDDEVALVISNGHATLTRVDVIAAVVHDDPFDGSGLVDAGVVVIEGTPGAGVPALPDNCLPLRNISVHATASAGTGGLTGANLSTDRRTYLAGLAGVTTDADVTYGPNVGATLEGSHVYRRGGMATLCVALTVTATVIAGATLLTVPTDYRPPQLIRGTLWVPDVNPSLWVAAAVTVATDGVLTVTGGIPDAATLDPGAALVGAITYPL